MVHIGDVYKMDNIYRVYEREFEIMGHHSTWPPYHGLRIDPNLELRSTMKVQINPFFE